MAQDVAATWSQVLILWLDYLNLFLVSLSPIS